ncbi:hypothetical protein TM1040_2515 [Ruegeria sp. TM1040]|jgi:hypothetical protein|uniref:hypothetical protein n=1 Tax=Ruegeria sp. (strain TM1040) TaxID=292414 RepID=UPI0000462E0D|nr:hypothetical protein [Ruegeria sp. TM1040]ABF65247.1 hypothetical protein TM1040_2515 [Ruegeria sp. TM1040]
MDTDLLLVTGLILAWLGVPAFFAAYAHRRSPITAAAMLILGGGCIAWAVLNHPGGYSLADVPDVFFRVIGRFL